ncbi:MAG: hypothetical protein KDK51_04200 [Deltaproteobacteria bacterium]|nr:hypothetical protein [Deltaproteobacteria bacterium]
MSLWFSYFLIGDDSTAEILKFIALNGWSPEFGEFNSQFGEKSNYTFGTSNTFFDISDASQLNEAILERVFNKLKYSDVDFTGSPIEAEALGQIHLNVREIRKRIIEIEKIIKVELEASVQNRSNIDLLKIYDLIFEKSFTPTLSGVIAEDPNAKTIEKVLTDKYNDIVKEIYKELAENVMMKKMNALYFIFCIHGKNPSLVSKNDLIKAYTNAKKVFEHGVKNKVFSENVAKSLQWDFYRGLASFIYELTSPYGSQESFGPSRVKRNFKNLNFTELSEEIVLDFLNFNFDHITTLRNNYPKVAEGSSVFVQHAHVLSFFDSNGFDLSSLIDQADIYFESLNDSARNLWDAFAVQLEMMLRDTYVPLHFRLVISGQEKLLQKHFRMFKMLFYFVHTRGNQGGDQMSREKAQLLSQLSKILAELGFQHNTGNQRQLSKQAWDLYNAGRYSEISAEGWIRLLSDQKIKILGEATGDGSRPIATGEGKPGQNKPLEEKNSNDEKLELNERLAVLEILLNRYSDYLTEESFDESTYDSAKNLDDEIRKLIKELEASELTEAEKEKLEGFKSLKRHLDVALHERKMDALDREHSELVKKPTDTPGLDGAGNKNPVVEESPNKEAKPVEGSTSLIEIIVGMSMAIDMLQDVDPKANAAEWKTAKAELWRQMMAFEAAAKEAGSWKDPRVQTTYEEMLTELYKLVQRERPIGMGIKQWSQEYSKSAGTFFAALFVHQVVRHVARRALDHNMPSIEVWKFLAHLPQESVRFVSFSAGAAFGDVGTRMAITGFWGLKDILKKKMMLELAEEGIYEEFKIATQARGVRVNNNRMARMVSHQVGFVVAIMLNKLIFEGGYHDGFFEESAIEITSFWAAQAVLRPIVFRARVLYLAAKTGKSIQVVLRTLNTAKNLTKITPAGVILGVVMLGVEMALAEPFNDLTTLSLRKSMLEVRIGASMDLLEQWAHGKQVKINYDKPCYGIKDSSKVRDCLWLDVSQSIEQYINLVVLYPTSKVFQDFYQAEKQVDSKYGIDHFEANDADPYKTGLIKNGLNMVRLPKNLDVPAYEAETGTHWAEYNFAVNKELAKRVDVLRDGYQWVGDLFEEYKEQEQEYNLSKVITRCKEEKCTADELQKRIMEAAMAFAPMVKKVKNTLLDPNNQEGMKTDARVRYMGEKDFLKRMSTVSMWDIVMFTGGVFKDELMRHYQVTPRVTMGNWIDWLRYRTYQFDILSQELAKKHINNVYRERKEITSRFESAKSQDAANEIKDPGYNFDVVLGQHVDLLSDLVQSMQNRVGEVYDSWSAMNAGNISERMGFANRVVLEPETIWGSITYFLGSEMDHQEESLARRDATQLNRPMILNTEHAGVVIPHGIKIEDDRVCKAYKKAVIMGAWKLLLQQTRTSKKGQTAKYEAVLQNAIASGKITQQEIVMALNYEVNQSPWSCIYGNNNNSVELEKTNPEVQKLAEEFRQQREKEYTVDVTKGDSLEDYTQDQLYINWYQVVEAKKSDSVVPKVWLKEINSEKVPRDDLHYYQNRLDSYMRSYYFDNNETSKASTH